MRFPYVFDLGEAIGEILGLCRLILKGQSIMTQELDDLNSALTDLETSNDASVAEIEKELATILAGSTGPNPDAAGVEAGVARIRAVIAAQQKALSDVVAATAPTPPEEAALALATTELTGGVVAQPYTGSLSISGGTAPYTVSASADVANGVSIDSTGAVSGTPTEAVTTTFSVTVTDSATPPAEVSGSVTMDVELASA